MLYFCKFILSATCIIVLIFVFPDEVVMTPFKKNNTTCIRLEKKAKAQIDSAQVEHAGLGQHTGLVINKQSGKSDN